MANCARWLLVVEFDWRSRGLNRAIEAERREKKSKERKGKERKAVEAEKLIKSKATKIIRKKAKTNIYKHKKRGRKEQNSKHLLITTET